MLRIIFWKIGSEWAHLKRILWPSTHRKLYYFAFGANLCVDVLARRRIKVYDEFDFALEGVSLRFSQMGFYKDHGYASADKSKLDAMKTNKVYGKIYLITQRDALRMDYFEGMPFLRAHNKIFHKSNGFDFYYYRARNVREGLKPTREYLDYILSAYQDMPGVPQAYLSSIAVTETLDQLLPQDRTGKYIDDICRWPVFLHPLLVRYERCCLAVVAYLWDRSLFQWMIKN